MSFDINTSGYIGFIKKISGDAKALDKTTVNKDNNVLDELETAIKFVNGEEETTTNKVLKKYDINADGKVDKQELNFSLDANGDGKLNKKDIQLSKNGFYTSREVIKDEDGTVTIYQFGRLQKKIYSNGKYRIYQRDTNGNLASSVTFRKDGSKYSEDTYVSSKDNLFNNKSSRPYESRKFYNSNGKLDRIEYYSYNQKSDGTIEKTITTDGSDYPKTVVTMDADKNEIKKTYITNENGKEIKQIDNNLDKKIDRTNEYKDGKLVKSTFKNGNYRFYTRDENGVLISSVTYRKDGTKYSEETYDSSSHKLFNNKSSKLYNSRTFYDKNGKNVERIEEYSYKNDSSDNIIKTTVLKPLELKQVNISVMDKDKNIKSETKFTLNEEAKLDKNGNVTNLSFEKTDMGNVSLIQNYVNGKLTTVWKRTGEYTKNGVNTHEREYYSYKKDGSYTVRTSKVKETIKADGTIATNNVTKETTLEYDKAGNLKSKTVYSGFQTLSDNNYEPNGKELDIKMPEYKTVYTYNKNKKTIKIDRERYEYDLDTGTKKVIKQTQTQKDGEVKYVDTKSSKTVNINQNHNPENVTGDEIVALAEKYLGYNRDNGNQFLFGTHGAWCSSFATFIYMELGIDLSQLQNRFRTSSSYSLAVAEERFTATTEIKNQTEADNLKGQFIIFGDTNDKTDNFELKHIGIVTEVKCNKDGTKTIKTIEGNSKDQVIKRTYTTNKEGIIQTKDYGDGRQVVGFADFITQ